MQHSENKIDISVIDTNPNSWVQQLLASNGIASSTNLQDKISALYFLQNHNMLKPVTLLDVYNLSNEFADAISSANGYPNDNVLFNKLSTIIILGNLGLLDSITMQYLSNPRFQELFLEGAGKLTNLFQNVASTLLSPRRSTITSPPRSLQSPPRSLQSPPRSLQSPSKSYQSPPRSYQSPPRSYQSPPRSYQSPPRSLQSPSRSYQSPPRSLQSPPRSEMITEGSYQYRLCELCKEGHIFNNARICGLCDDESMIPTEVEHDIQIDYYGADAEEGYDIYGDNYNYN